LRLEPIYEIRQIAVLFGPYEAIVRSKHYRLHRECDVARYKVEILDMQFNGLDIGKFGYRGEMHRVNRDAGAREIGERVLEVGAYEAYLLTATLARVPLATAFPWG
jgi:hypothetical protein